MQGLLKKIPSIEHLVEFSFDILVHPYRDPGVFNGADEFLKPLIGRYDYALVLLDHQGCGREQLSVEAIEASIASRLEATGWQNRSAVICIEPELENWIWVSEVRMQEVIAWKQPLSLYEWLHRDGWKQVDQPKPYRPKEAFEAAIKLCRVPRSSSLYYRIASQASYRHCRDIAFQKMRVQLKDWFST